MGGAELRARVHATTLAAQPLAVEKVRAGELAWKTAIHIWGMLTKLFDDAHRAIIANFALSLEQPAQLLNDWLTVWPTPSSTLTVTP